MAVVKVAISKPGTNLEVSQSRATLIKNAVMPKVTMEIGRAISWSMGLIKVLTTPMITAATIAAEISDKINPGTKYSTTRRAKTLIASLMTNFINSNNGVLRRDLSRPRLK